MVLSKGVRAPETRAGRPRLTAIAPHIEDLVRHLNLDVHTINIARQAGKSLWAARNDFDVRRRRAGLFVPDRRIDKEEADRMLRALLAAHAAGGAK